MEERNNKKLKGGEKLQKKWMTAHAGKDASVAPGASLLRGDGRQRNKDTGRKRGEKEGKRRRCLRKQGNSCRRKPTIHHYEGKTLKREEWKQIRLKIERSRRRRAGRKPAKTGSLPFTVW